MFFHNKTKTSRKVKSLAKVGLISTVTTVTFTQILMAGSSISETPSGEIVSLDGAVVTDVGGNAVRYQVDGQRSERARSWFTTLEEIHEALVLLPQSYGESYAELRGLIIDDESGESFPVEPRYLTNVAH